jgi:hypothetical protein
MRKRNRTTDKHPHAVALVVCQPCIWMSQWRFQSLGANAVPVRPSLLDKATALTTMGALSQGVTSSVADGAQGLITARLEAERRV